MHRVIIRKTANVLIISPFYRWGNLNALITRFNEISGEFQKLEKYGQFNSADEQDTMMSEMEHLYNVILEKADKPSSNFSIKLQEDGFIYTYAKARRMKIKETY